MATKVVVCNQSVFIKIKNNIVSSRNQFHCFKSIFEIVREKSKNFLQELKIQTRSNFKNLRKRNRNPYDPFSSFFIQNNSFYVFKKTFNQKSYFKMEKVAI